MRVQLEPYEYELVNVVGLRRHAANLAKRDAAHYDPARMEDNLTASVAAAAAELAVAKVTMRYWPAAAWDSSQHHQYAEEPDVYPNLEVRRIRKPGNPLAVRARDVDRRRVMVSAWPDPEQRFQSVTMVGWLPADKAWALGRPSPYDPSGTRLVEQEYLYPVTSLVAPLPGGDA